MTNGKNERRERWGKLVVDLLRKALPNSLASAGEIARDLGLKEARVRRILEGKAHLSLAEILQIPRPIAQRLIELCQERLDEETPFRSLRVEAWDTLVEIASIGRSLAAGGDIESFADEVLKKLISQIDEASIRLAQMRRRIWRERQRRGG